MILDASLQVPSDDTVTVGPAKWIDPHAVTIPADRATPAATLLDQMAASFRDFGQLVAILITGDGALVEGQSRLLTARALKQRVLARVVEGSLEALGALRREGDFVRLARQGALEAALYTHAMDVWYDDRGIRAGQGRSGGLTVAGLAARCGIAPRMAERHLKIARGLSPAALDVLLVQPDAGAWELAELDRFVGLAPETQEQLAARLGDEAFDDLLDVAAPRPERPATPPETQQVARLKAFVSVAAELGGPWTAWGAEAAALQARIEAWLAGEAPPAPAPERTPSPAAGPESAFEADERPADEVLPEPSGPGRDGGGRRPADVVREALPDVDAALAAGQAALDRARRTGHRPASTTVTLESAVARVAAVVAPAMGVTADGASVSGPSDAVDVVRVLAEALAPRMRGRGALARLSEAVAALPRPAGPPG